jgi:hypothetical protein
LTALKKKPTPTPLKELTGPRVNPISAQNDTKKKKELQTVVQRLESMPHLRLALFVCTAPAQGLKVDLKK